MLINLPGRNQGIFAMSWLMCCVVFFCITDVQAKYEQVNFGSKKNSKFNIEACKNPNFVCLIHMLFCQIGDDI